MRQLKRKLIKLNLLLRNLAINPHPIEGILRTVIGVVGDDRGKPQDAEVLRQYNGVERVVPIEQPYKLASREVQETTSPVKVAGTIVGNENIAVIAGPVLCRK